MPIIATLIRFDGALAPKTDAGTIIGKTAPAAHPSICRRDIREHLFIIYCSLMAFHGSKKEWADMNCISRIPNNANSNSITQSRTCQHQG
jgi:hypothetical protein